MRNFDPYKKTILFFLSLLNIILMTILFSYFWYHYFAETMYTFRFYRRGNYVVIILYAVFLIFFTYKKVEWNPNRITSLGKTSNMRN